MRRAAGTAWFLDLVQSAIAELLRLDPRAMDALALMTGKVIGIEVSGLGLTLYVLLDAQGVRLLSAYEGEVHVLIRGTPLSLLALGQAQDARAASFSGGVEIIGDLALAQRLQSLLRSLHIDWEELLSGYAGDIVAHQLGNVSRSLARWLVQTRETLELNIAEYLKAETEILPWRDELKEFLHAVDALHADAERLEARLRRIERPSGTAR